MAGLCVLVLVLFVVSLCVGSAPLGPAELWRAATAPDQDVAAAILWEIRLPRAILAVLVGAILGASGASLQGLLRNPLAEPSVLGASNAAALGAVVVLYFGLADLFALAMPLAGVAGALVALLLLVALVGRAESALTVVLAGIGIGTLAGAGISLALNLSPNPFAAMEIAFWLLGSLEDRAPSHVWLALPLVSAGLVLLVWDRRSLDALALGEDAARSMGINLVAVRARIVLGVALGVGAAVAVSGAIGFIGLVVPHLVRGLGDPRPGAIVLPSAAAGAALLLCADILVRLVPATTELRVGVVTAFLGVPFFLHIVFRQRRVW